MITLNRYFFILRVLLLLSIITMTLVGCFSQTGDAAPQKPFLQGVNLAGAEFGETMPGEHGTDYIVPEPKDISRYSQMGFNIIRLPFRWERLQPKLYSRFNQKAWQRLDAAMKAAADNKTYLILDVHNYARRKIAKDGYQKSYMIGSRQVPTAAFVDFWQKLARRTANRPYIIYGLMNEPYDISAKDWLPIAQQAINAIRNQKAKNLILATGVAYSGAHSWMWPETGNRIMKNLKDPLNNMAMEVHQYLDADSSGTNPKTVSKTIGAERLQAFQDWARKHKIKAFLGEFGAGADAVGLAAISNMLKEVAANKDVWIGWTAWAAGPWWPDDDKFTLERTSKGIARKQTLLLQKIVR